MANTAAVPSPRAAVATAPGFDVERIRAQFPILKRTFHDQRFAYLDSAATTQKPQQVLDALMHYYAHTNANIHRGVYSLAEEATAAYEGVREQVARFVGGVDPHGIVFTRGTTEAVNLVAESWGRTHLKAGDEILLTEMEHHSNLVPWFLIAEKTGAVIRHIPVTKEHTLDMAAYGKLLNPRTRIVSVTWVSNVLGTINPVADVVAAAHAAGAAVMVDAAQAAPHLPMDLKALDAEFVAFSSHKMLGPTGVGVLVAKPDLLRSLPPYQGGGEMIRRVELCSATWNDIPWRFEAGTPNIADVIAFGAALDYLAALGWDALRAHEQELTRHALERIGAVKGMTCHGPRDLAQRSGVVSFHHDTIHPHDLATFLDHRGVAVRAGHHCAQPLMRVLDVTATARASFHCYNNREDVDQLAGALLAAEAYFAR